MADTKYAWLNEKSAFARDIPKMRKHDAGLPASSHGTESVVAAIVHAVESSRPKSRYIAPKSYAQSIWFSKFLPDWVKDWVMRGYAGL